MDLFFLILQHTVTSEVNKIEEYYEKGGRVPSVMYPDNPQILGPLQINKDKYLLGENIYVILKDLRPQDKGSVLFITPGGTIYDEWGFNGDRRNQCWYYFILWSKL